MKFDNLVYSTSVANIADIWKKVLHEGKKIEKPKGYTLIDKSQTVRYLYYLEKGEISFVHNYDDGRKVLIGKSVGPSLVGETMFFFGQSIGYASIITSTPCTLYAFSDTWVYNELMPNHPELALNIIQNLSTKSMKLIKQKIFNNSLSLTCLLGRFLKEHIVEEKGEVYSKTNLTQIELAEFFSVHHISINKSLRKLKEQGVIESYNKKKTKILNMELLDEIIQGV